MSVNTFMHIAGFKPNYGECGVIPQCPPTDRGILQLRENGVMRDTIAGMLGCGLRTLDRRIANMKGT